MSIFALQDAMRRRMGDTLERAGLAPIPSGTRVAASWTGARLLAHQDPGSGPVVLIVPATIKRSYIWDLMPAVSVVRACRQAGFATYRLDWTVPGPAERGFSLADYADRLIRLALDRVAEETGAAGAVLVGHSIGGTYAAIFAALHPERVQALALLETPLAFGSAAGAFAPLVAAAPPARVVAARAGDPVPGSFLNLATVTAAPEHFVAGVAADRIAVAGEPALRAIHMRVMRWMLDEFPQPVPLFVDLVDRLYREDRFRRGTLEVGERVAALAAIRCPILVVVNPESRVVPVPSAVPEAIRDRVRLIAYRGEPGVGIQHLGPLVGPSAHRDIWPEVLAWAGRCASG